MLLTPLPPRQPLTANCNLGSGTPLLHSGGLDRASRCNCLISAATTEPSAVPKCQLSGFSPASRRAIQRE